MVEGCGFTLISQPLSPLHPIWSLKWRRGGRGRDVQDVLYVVEEENKLTKARSGERGKNNCKRRITERIRLASAKNKVVGFNVEPFFQLAVLPYLSCQMRKGKCKCKSPFLNPNSHLGSGKTASVSCNLSEVELGICFDAQIRFFFFHINKNVHEYIER